MEFRFNPVNSPLADDERVCVGRHQRPVEDRGRPNVLLSKLSWVSVQTKLYFDNFSAGVLHIFFSSLQF